MKFTAMLDDADDEENQFKNETARQRQDFLNLSMKDRINEFSDNVDFNIFCGTWNICNKKPNNEQKTLLRHWLLPTTSDTTTTNTNKIHPDIYSIGFQEIVDLNARNIVIDGSKSIENSLYWCDIILDILHTTKIPYICLLERHLVGVLLLVFVKEALIPQISDVRGTCVSIGVLGMCTYES